MKVLVVEDDPFAQKLAKSILEKNSIEVDVAESGREALSFLEKDGSVDVIVSDVMMPGMDGFVFLQQLNLDKRLNKIPVILCTALNDQKSIVKGIEAGIAGYVVKPVKEEALISQVKKAAESRPGAILVVDDEEIIRNMLSMTLERNGYKVLSASGYDEAIEIIEKNRISLVITDIAMPNKDGFALLSHLKADKNSISVILMSGRTDHKREEIVAAGADDFIPKPFHNQEILSRVRACYLR